MNQTNAWYDRRAMKRVRQRITVLLWVTGLGMLYLNLQHITRFIQYLLKD